MESNPSKYQIPGKAEVVGMSPADELKGRAGELFEMDKNH
jgi:hypothetical protein